MFFRDLLQRLWIVGLLEKACILGIMEWSAQNRRPRQLEFCSSYQLIPCAGTMRVHKRLSDSHSKSWLFSRKLFPDTCLGENTKSFTSSDLIPVDTPLVTDSFCFSCSFSSSVKPEWMIRNKSPVSEASALKCMVSLLFFFFRIPTTQSTDTLEYWMTSIFESLHRLGGCRVPFSFMFVQKSSIPLLFVSSTEERPVFLRESFRVFLNFSECEITNSFISFSCPIDVVEHWHEDGQVCEHLRFDFPFAGFSEESAMTRILGEYFTRIQLVLHRFPAVLCKKETFLNSSTWPSYLVIAPLLSFIFTRHCTESE